MPPLKPVSSEAAAAATAAAAAAAGPAGPAALAAALAELSGPSAIGQVGEGKPELGGDDAAKAAAGGAEDVDNAAALAAVAAPSGAGPTEALPAVEAEGTGAGKGKGKENDAVDADSGGEGKGKPDDPKGKDAEAGKSEEPAAGASGADDHRDCTDDQRRKRSETLGNATRLEKDMTGMLRRVIDDIYQVRFREHGALPSAFPCPFLLRRALPPQVLLANRTRVFQEINAGDTERHEHSVPFSFFVSPASIGVGSSWSHRGCGVVSLCLCSDDDDTTLEDDDLQGWLERHPGLVFQIEGAGQIRASACPCAAASAERVSHHVVGERRALRRLLIAGLC